MNTITSRDLITHLQVDQNRRYAALFPDDGSPIAMAQSVKGSDHPSKGQTRLELRMAALAVVSNAMAT